MTVLIIMMMMITGFTKTVVRFPANPGSTGTITQNDVKARRTQGRIGRQRNSCTIHDSGTDIHVFANLVRLILMCTCFDIK